MMGRGWIVLIMAMVMLEVQVCSTSIRRAVSPQKSPVVAFYNVENLFDTIDDPQTHDEEFTPHSKRRWTSSRYHRKLAQLADVIAWLGPPLVIGVAEIENEQTVANLARAIYAQTGRSYLWVHHESPDHRGIDVALLYMADSVEALLKKDFIRVDLSSGKTTREILHAELVVRWDGVRDTLHFFVNHWPSRREGKRASEPHRIIAARTLRNAIVQVLRDAPQAEIIVMGDFNDEPTDKSITQILGALWDDSNAFLINLMANEVRSGGGSYRYRQWWNLLDQIMVSSSLRRPEGIYVDRHLARVFRDSRLLEDDERFGGQKPYRTYLGPRYHGGMSDHLPVYLILEVYRSK